MNGRHVYVSSPRLASAVLDHDAAILNDLDAGALELLREFVVPNPELEPHEFRLLREDVVHVRHEVPRAAKDVHQVDVPRNVGELAIDPLPEDLRDLRVVDRHGHDLETCILQVLGHVKSRLRRLRFGLDAEHGDAARALEEVADYHPRPWMQLRSAPRKRRSKNATRPIRPRRATSFTRAARSTSRASPFASSRRTPIGSPGSTARRAAAAIFAARATCCSRRSSVVPA